jgi:RimJ/RimL family protein N-acetyltransferase
LFEDEGAHRVQLTTDIDNAAMRRLSERLGLVFEGMLRNFMPSTDGPRDYAMYAMTSDDYEDVKARWTSTN